LLSLNKSYLFKPVYELPPIFNGETTFIKIAPEHLPGEFVLRFDYFETEKSSVYPSEKSFVINNQNLELWVSPKYCNNADSTYFQQNETENKTINRFRQTNAKMKEQLGLLQSLLMNYDAPESKYYQSTIQEYEQRRKTYNNWIDSSYKADRELFVSSLYRFEKVPKIVFRGSETDRIKGIIAHYFDEIDFDNPIIIRSSKIFEFMNNYVNLTGQLCTTVELRDSLIPAAAVVAIETARKGNPIIYGWMVDYFYRGFETNAIDAGIKVLKPYIDDPKCLTSKKIEIEKRLEGMKTIMPGIKAPEISMPDESGGNFSLNAFKTDKKYILLVFWSADCSHCVETVQSIFPWSQNTDIANKLSVVAVSLDETSTEIAKWDQKHKELTNWLHLRAIEGIRSKAAADYFILATPVMVLMDAQSKTIRSMPVTSKELFKDFEKLSKE
jgi:thiol-disulfide isomerase/thioredoxin